MLFTCAVYRAVHLELILSLSTNSFLQGLRRFIARRGRPKIIYSDHGSNFVGRAICSKILTGIKLLKTFQSRRFNGNSTLLLQHGGEAGGSDLYRW